MMGGSVGNKNIDVTTSYGCILYTIEQDKVYWLFMQRRDTIALIYLLKTATHLKYYTLQYYMNRLSPTEKFLLENYNIEELVHEFSVNRTPSHRRRVYENIKLIKCYLKREYCPTMEKDWEFPKGRRMDNESHMGTAIRELVEETCIDKNLVVQVPIATINETYNGLNKLPYKNVFFVMNYERRVDIKKHFTNKIRSISVSHEASDVRWIETNELRRMKTKHEYCKILTALSKKILEQKTTKDFHIDIFT